ncbi:hypothetical protein CEXT_14831 [Caerostris extrusa]|uniref:Uncharacterized protein n=1 Tax=Caerostris extrusa TaxID=172846 RepID=A0AAV4XRC7_CAEEX|nr:hypothetical protein CEXT_14831 [Caerostris extrusa]
MTSACAKVGTYLTLRKLTDQYSYLASIGGYGLKNWLLQIADSVKHDMKMKLDIQGYNCTASFKGRPTSKGHGLCPVGYGGRDSMANIVLPFTFNCTVNNFFCQIQLHKSDQN